MTTYLTTGLYHHPPPPFIHSNTNPIFSLHNTTPSQYNNVSLSLIQVNAMSQIWNACFGLNVPDFVNEISNQAKQKAKSHSLVFIAHEYRYAHEMMTDDVAHTLVHCSAGCDHVYQCIIMLVIRASLDPSQHIYIHTHHILTHVCVCQCVWRIRNLGKYLTWFILSTSDLIS